MNTAMTLATFISGIVTPLVTEIFSIGTSLVTFITTDSNFLCLIPVGLWLVVSAVGVIRRLIQGV